MPDTGSDALVPVYKDEPYQTVPELVEEQEIEAYPQVVGDFPELKKQLLAVARGKKTVTIYRGGLPKGADIDVGDFVALDRKSAEQYVASEGSGAPDYGIDARYEGDVWWQGDYSEWEPDERPRFP